MSDAATKGGKHFFYGKRSKKYLVIAEKSLTDLRREMKFDDETKKMMIKHMKQTMNSY